MQQTFANTFCPLNSDVQEEEHANMSGGTWPMAEISEYTGELVITNYRFCNCFLTGKPHAQGDEFQVFYYD